MKSRLQDATTAGRGAMRAGFRLSALAIGAAFAACAGTGADAQNFTMKFGTATVNEPQHEYIKIYKEEIEQRSAGKIKVEIYPQSQLGPIPRQIEGLQLGTIEAFIGPADFYVGVDKRFGVFSAPILFRDRKNAAAADRKSTRLNSSHLGISYAVFC